MCGQCILDFLPFRAVKKSTRLSKRDRSFLLCKKLEHVCICSNEKDKVEVDEHGASQGVGVTGGKEGVGDAPKDVYESGFAFGKM